MECMTTTSFSLVINGSIFGHFTCAHGLRQGNPLSPYLFIICIEALSRQLNHLSTNLDFMFHPKCASQKMKHLVHVDDLILFARGDMPSISLLENYLDTFDGMAGPKVNKLIS